jgi:O-antigen ligase
MFTKGFMLKADNIPSREFTPVLSFAATVLLCVLLLALAPLELVSAEGLQVIGVVALLLICLTIGLVHVRKQTGSIERIALHLALILWWFLIILEQLFPRRRETESVYEGSLALTAYGEALVWVVISLILATLWFAAGPTLRSLFRGPLVALTLYALFCLFSVAYAPRPGFSLAFAFKLVLIVMLLRFVMSLVRDPEDLRRFVRWTLAGFLVLALLPLAQAFSNPESAFGWTTESGTGQADVRLNAIVHPISVSEWGGIVLLLAMTIFRLEHRRWQFAIAFLGTAILLIGAGKAAVVSGVLSVLLLFFLQRSFKQGVIFGAGAAAIGLLLMLTTPVFNHFSYYAASGNVATLTGRTDLWEAAMPTIQSHLLLGSGYMASKFVSIETETYWDAGHLHNGFIEALYNNGLIGLALLTFILGFTLFNLVSALRTARDSRIRVFASGFIALYFFLFLNAMVEANFGGRPSSFFMIQLALAAGSHVLGGFARRRISVATVNSP